MIKYMSICLLLCGVLLGGCDSSATHVRPEAITATGAKVAVIPFDTLSGHPNAGAIMAGLLDEELRARGCLELLPQGDVMAKLAPVEGEVLSPAALGKRLGADVLLRGSITEYRYKRGVGEEPVIGLTIQLVDCKSGQVLWSATRTRVGRYSWVTEDSLSRLAHAMCRELAATLCRGMNL